MSTQDPVVIPPAATVAAQVVRARGARMAVLVGPHQGAPNFVTRRFELDPGGRIPMHAHPTIEHEQVVVRGTMIITLAGEDHVVHAGDAVFIPAGTPHAYANLGDETVEFICVVPNTSGYATQWLEEPPEGAFSG